MKKAVLVEFSIKTRVIVDDTFSEDEIAEVAAEQILRNGAEDYICPDNLVSVEDDIEAPYSSYDEARAETIEELARIRADFMAQD